MHASDFEQFVAALYESGILAAAEIQTFFDAIPEDRCPTTSEGLAEEMIRRGMLTPFQAQTLCQGKGRALALGNYIVLDRLGKGGMGRLFRCMHKRMRRVVALKVLPPNSMKSPEKVALFQREVEAMARLSHPNIITAFDAGEDKGVRFLAMEYVDGHDLASLVAVRGKVSVPLAVDYVLQAARGLEYAHWHGMIHRDVKPDNLMLDWRETIKVLDLGIVGLVAGISDLGEHARDDAREGPARFGTPDYIAPEQIDGSKIVGPACDIYSLGCTLHFLLTGNPVFREETVDAKLQAHCEQPAPALRSACPDAPQPLEELFQRMLAKRPQDRPVTMGEVIVALERCHGLLRSAEATSRDRGKLLVDVCELDAAVRVLDDAGHVVVDCPSARGRLTFALPAGRYRLIVRRRDGEHLVEEFEIAASQHKAVHVPPPQGTDGPAR